MILRPQDHWDPKILGFVRKIHWKRIEILLTTLWCWKGEILRIFEKCTFVWIFNKFIFGDRMHPERFYIDLYHHTDFAYLTWVSRKYACKIRQIKKKRKSMVFGSFCIEILCKSYIIRIFGIFSNLQAYFLETQVGYAKSVLQNFEIVSNDDINRYRTVLDAFYPQN